MHKHVSEALQVLEFIGIPEGQRTEQAALCLLAIIDLGPKDKWRKASSPLMGITPIMNWIAASYGKHYAPNTRETIRKSAMHTFVNAGIAVQNPDRPDRPVNSPKWVYQIHPNALDLLKTYGTRDWALALGDFLQGQPTLIQKYANERDALKIAIKIAGDVVFSLSPGAHSDLIHAIIRDFGAIFVPDGELLYVGDTGEKWGFFNESVFEELGVRFDEHGIMPDVVIYCRRRNWLVLIEAVASSGPVDGKRHHALKNLFSDSSAGLVFVTAFPDGKLMRKFITEIAWETEVWRADTPTHLIHFNGERFLGPY